VLKGKEMIIELANDKIKVWGREMIEGKSLLDIMPELKDTFHERLDEVRATGIPFMVLK
jgi:hypothetical protein